MSVGPSQFLASLAAAAHPPETQNMYFATSQLFTGWWRPPWNKLDSLLVNSPRDCRSNFSPCFVSSCCGWPWKTPPARLNQFMVIIIIKRGKRTKGNEGSGCWMSEIYSETDADQWHGGWGNFFARSSPTVGDPLWRRDHANRCFPCQPIGQCIF